MVFGENMPLDVLFVRDDDIPDLVQEDVCDLGLVGLQCAGGKTPGACRARRRRRFQELCTLDFGRCRLSSRCPRASSTTGPLACRASASPPPIRTCWGAYLRKHDVRAEIVTLLRRGRDRTATRARGLICDLVSTGSTLQANHLREVATVLESHAVLIRTPLTLAGSKDDWVERLLMRIDGVQQVRESKYIMLHAPRSALADIRRLLPGSESPTIIPLEGFHDRVAVHAVCRENVFWETLESLKKAGASALLVLPVEKMLA